jgi:glycosyltransferase involved in cell wall biosynthesis
MFKPRIIPLAAHNSAMQPCVYYHPEAYTTSGPKLMGRNAAGESFLRGYLQHGRPEAWWVQVSQEAHARHFAASAQAAGRQEPVQAVTKANLGALAQSGLLYLPGPGLAEHAGHRALVGGAAGHAAWALCGITHTTSSAGAMDAVVQLVTEPIQPWDALICTSTAVKTHVEHILQARVDELQRRLGISRVVLPMMPVIPLGVHAQDFEVSPAPREAARQALGAEPNALVVLFMGRLSFHAKAHPLAMYQALEEAARRTSKRVVLVECGWHANDFIRKAYADAAALACPSVRVVNLDGRVPEQRLQAWACADVFCSLSDNIQETFGITPIEAMAAGLPVVVSDWDGYKDTVRDGVDGFRVPTTMPPGGLGTDLAARHALELDTYDMYCGHTCSLVAVDVQACASAFERLFASPELRRQMGRQGQERARSVYDWKTVIGQYEQLWAHQDAQRQAALATAAAAPVRWPARLDPFQAFSHYATHVLSGEDELALASLDPGAAQAQHHACRGLAMVNFANRVVPEAAWVEQVLEQLAQRPAQVQALLSTHPPDQRALLWRGLVWMLKMGLVRRTAAFALDSP